MNNFLDTILSASFVFSSLRLMTPILFPALGAIVANKAGVPNIGLEGIMLMSALAGVAGSAFTGIIWMGLLSAILTGVFMALILAYFTLQLETDVILGGIALNLFASGASILLLFLMTGDRGSSIALNSGSLPNFDIPIIKNIPFLGEAISGHNLLTYVAFLCVILVSYMIKKMPLGMHIRAVGKNPDAAASVGISVRRTRYIALLISGALCGLGGVFLSMGHVSWFSVDMTSGRGWLALAAEAVGRGSVVGTVLSSMLFGVASAISNVLSLFQAPSELVSTLPFVATVIALVIYSVLTKKRQSNPAMQIKRKVKK